jgi:hypothetical protein
VPRAPIAADIAPSLDPRLLLLQGISSETAAIFVSPIADPAQAHGKPVFTCFLVEVFRRVIARPDPGYV